MTEGHDIERLLGEAAEGLDPASRREMRRRVVAHARADVTYKRPRTAALFATIALVVLTTMSSAAYATTTALPGDLFYGMKRAIEDVRLAVVPEGGYRETLRHRYAQERAAELTELIESGADAALVEAVLDDMLEARERVRSGEDETQGEATRERFTPEEERALRLGIEEGPATVREKAEDALREGDGGPGGPDAGDPAGPDDPSGPGPSDGGSDHDAPGAGDGSGSGDGSGDGSSSGDASGDGSGSGATDHGGQQGPPPDQPDPGGTPPDETQGSSGADSGGGSSSSGSGSGGSSGDGSSDSSGSGQGAGQGGTMQEPGSADSGAGAPAAGEGSGR